MCRFGELLRQHLKEAGCWPPPPCAEVRESSGGGAHGGSPALTTGNPVHPNASRPAGSPPRPSPWEGAG